MFLVCFFFNDTATTEIYTLSLHDALPISARARSWSRRAARPSCSGSRRSSSTICARSEEHTSELQSHVNLVCRLLLEKKKKNNQVKSNLQIENHNIAARKTTAIRQQILCY